MIRSVIRLCLVLAAAVALGACASAPGDPRRDETSFEEARRAYLTQDYPRALALMRREAELGNPRAQYALGYMYYYGQGVQQDMEEALRWIRQAAAQGDARALEALGALAAASMRPKSPPADGEGRQ